MDAPLPAPPPAYHAVLQCHLPRLPNLCPLPQADASLSPSALLGSPGPVMSQVGQQAVRAACQPGEEKRLSARCSHPQRCQSITGTGESWSHMRPLCDPLAACCCVCLLGEGRRRWCCSASAAASVHTLMCHVGSLLQELHRDYWGQEEIVPSRPR